MKLTNALTTWAMTLTVEQLSYLPMENGLNLMDAMKFGQELGNFDDVARKANFLEQKIKAYQVWSIDKWNELCIQVKKRW